MAGRKNDKEPGKAASIAPPKRLALSDKTAQAVFVDTEVSHSGNRLLCGEPTCGGERQAALDHLSLRLLFLNRCTARRRICRREQQ